MNTVTEDLLTQWRTCNSDIVNNPNDCELIKRFTILLNHVEAVDNLIPLRLLKKFKKCIKQTQSILAVILDQIDLNDPQSTSVHIFKLYRAFANIKMIRLTYQLGEEPSLDIDENLKWFDLSSLLPVTSDTNWKRVYRDCFSRNTTNADLFKSILDLYLQKLRFCAILENSEQYQEHSTLIRATAMETVKKLVESNYSQHNIRMDEEFICAIMPYTDSALYPIISEAIVQDRFLFSDLSLTCNQNLNTDQLLENNISIQTQLVTTLLKHLRGNILRNKRKNDEDTVVSPLLNIIEQVTFEQMSPGQLLQTVTKLMENCDNMDDNELVTGKSTESIDLWSSILSACNGASTSLTSKTVQKSYIVNWLDVVQTLAKHQYLIIPNRLRIFTATSILLISTSPFIQLTTVERILGYMTGLIEDLPKKEASIFFKLIPAGQYLIKLTNCLSNNTQLFEKLETCLLLERFLSLFLNTYMNCTLDRSDSLSEYVDFIVDEKLDKVVGTYSQLIIINEILSTDTFTSRKQVVAKRPRTSLQLSIRPDLLQSVSPCIIKLKSVVAANQHSLLSKRDDEDLFTSIITRATISIIKLFIIQRDMDGLKEHETFLGKLFGSIITTIGYHIQSNQTKRKSKKVNHHLCDDQFIDLIEFYNRYRTQLESVLNLRIMTQLHEIIISSIEGEADQNDDVKSSKLSKRMTKELKTKTLDDSKLKISKSKNLSTTHMVEVEEVCYPEMKRILLKVAPLIFSTCDAATFQNSVDKILDRILDCDISDHSLVVRSLILLESVYLASPTYNLEKAKILSDNFEKIIACITKVAKQSECRQSIHTFKDAGIHKSMTSVKCCISIRCLTSFVLLFRSPNQSKISTKEELTYGSLQMVSFSNLRNYAQNSQYAYNQFLDLASITYSVLNECLLKKSVIALNIMPTFNSIFTEFIRCLLIASDRCKLEKIKDTIDQAKFEEIEHRFEVLALDTAKIMTQLSLMRANFIGCAPYLISSYIKDVQIVTSHARVRLHLNEGIFRIFNQIDAHQEEYKTNQTVQANQRKTHAGGAQGSIFEMIHARSDQSSREIFRDMHDNYEKFHRFTGRY